MIYALDELNNYMISSDMITIKEVTWPASSKDCTHVSYLKLQESWYLLIGFTGSLEVYNEDGSKMLFNCFASNYKDEQTRIQSSSYISSCPMGPDMFLVGDSQGCLFKF